MQAASPFEHFGTPVFDVPALEDTVSDAVEPNTSGNSSPSTEGEPEIIRPWRDLFWLSMFVLHIVWLGLALGLLGLNRFQKVDRFKLDKFTSQNLGFAQSQDRTEDFWPIYGTAAGIGAIIAWVWLLFLFYKGNQMMKFAVHSTTTYLAIIGVCCFWIREIFWGIVCVVGAALQFLYVMSVMDRLPFSMLVLCKAIKLLWELPEASKLSFAFLATMLMWMVLWSFGVSGVVAANMSDGQHWSVLGVLSVSLFWTGAVLCNVVHVIVASLVVFVLVHGGMESQSMPQKPFLRSFRHSVSTSLGSICYGSLFTAAIRTLRWAIRGIRSLSQHNECLLCCINFLFNLVETLVRFFNKYAYVQVAVTGKSFNCSACDAWELLQSTGVEALVAYDCSGAILLMAVLLGGLITGSCVGTWAWFKLEGQAIMIGSTAMFMGMILVGMTLVVVESAITSLYICYARDPSVISRWDPVFHKELYETLHQRLQHRSGREVPRHHLVSLPS